jgi:hypothetical protein
MNTTTMAKGYFFSAAIAVIITIACLMKTATISAHRQVASLVKEILSAMILPKKQN